MPNSLFDRNGQRKYLVARERLAFVRTASRTDVLIATFCLTLAIAGPRISEVLALKPENLDPQNGAIVFKTLKQRGKIVFRAIPVPSRLLRMLMRICREPGKPIWPWKRTKGWQLVKSVMREAGIAEYLCKPKALRHGFAVEATQRSVPLDTIQRWLGHARIETTTIYTGVLGREERNLARKTWPVVKGF